MKRELLLISVLLVLVSGCGNELTGNAVMGDHIVEIENEGFSPASLEVKTGETVVWVNDDTVKHSVTFEDVRLDAVLEPGETVSYTFTEKGEARYFCKFQPGIEGSILAK